MSAIGFIMMILSVTIRAIKICEGFMPSLFYIPERSKSGMNLSPTEESS